MTLNPLEVFLANQIEVHGPMRVGAFMSHALSHPEHGYYMTRDPFGQGGDFTTAPEVSQMFGEMIGAWVADIWLQMGRPAVNLVECGPGRGTLMADALRVLRRVEGFAEAVSVHLVEISPHLRSIQEKILGEYHINWVSNIDEIARDRPSIVIANELLDALPIEQLRRSEGGWQQRHVTYAAEQGFSFDWLSASTDVIACLPSTTESHQVYEVAPARMEFCDSVLRLFDPAGGAALMTDYGYNKRHHGDTLQAVRQHEFKDVLSDVGEQDITAHVDFEALVNHLSERVMVERIVTQGRFLNALGIGARAQSLRQNERFSEQVDQDLERLTSADEMGELFKVMCFSFGFGFKVAGF